MPNKPDEPFAPDPLPTALVGWIVVLLASGLVLLLAAVAYL